MIESSTSNVSRRGFSKGVLAAAGTLASMRVPAVHAAGSDVINVALIGCGGRGTGAAGNALSVQTGPTKLVAMADVFEDKLKRSFESLSRSYKEKVDVPDNRKFISFDGYKQAIDCLKPGDVAIFATPPAFRWVHFTYAIEKGINVFMEKPVTVDGPSTRRMLKLYEEAMKKNMKVGVGLMCRHCDCRRALYEQLQNGALGDIITMRSYRMQMGGGATGAKPADMTDLMFQIRKFHSFLWASGGVYSDYNIHNIDECCWMKGAWPVKAQGIGGRHYRGENVDQNFDMYNTEFTFPDGTKMFYYGRTINQCHNEFASYAHGTKGVAVISTDRHTPAKCRIFKGHIIHKDYQIWNYGDEPSPYQLEWEHLTDAIRKDKPYNEVKRGAEASLVTAMGRAACHTGKIITFDDMLNSDQEMGVGVDKLTFASAAPLLPGPDGKYAVPNPGKNGMHEY